MANHDNSTNGNDDLLEYDGYVGVADSLDPSIHRYKEITNGVARKELALLTKKAKLPKRIKDGIEVVIDLIRLPRFKFGEDTTGMVYGIGSGGGAGGQGPGPGGKELQEGDVIGHMQPDQGQGTGPGGSSSGPGNGSSNGPGAGGSGGQDSKNRTVVDMETIKKFLGEEMKLPNLTEVHGGQMNVIGRAYKSVTDKGPQALLRRRQTLLNAIKRELGEGTLDISDPLPNITPDDMRYLWEEEILEPKTRAAIVFVRDISGSMHGDRTERAISSAFWLNLWIKMCYKDKVNVHYVLHDTEGKEVSEDEFRSINYGGGTRMTSGIEKAEEILREKYPPSKYNNYIFVYGDGEYMGESDLKGFISSAYGMVLEGLVRRIGYTEVEKADDQMRGHLNRALSSAKAIEVGIPKVVKTTHCEDDDRIIQSVKELLDE